jgi:hypothetical protein
LVGWCCKRPAREEVRVRSVPASVSGYGSGVVLGRHPAELGGDDENTRVYALMKYD